MEILKSQDKSNSADDPFICPLTPSQGASSEASELDTSSMNFLDSSYEAPQSNYEGFASETPEPASVSTEASGVKTPKQNSLRETLMLFRKNTKKHTAPSTAARVAACIEAKHI
ncbi:hypothetical protein AVEN_98752-1 [Araneus ventricosus]|uniref:Uncharacterized protein n=1 Tax=Araneus ventricosus TaxID=182803 RepID=A0A4Y2PTX3_ARAVE|nr:hypothetical protein AVEN_98752-1 [Araneus ventricosus]